MADEPTKNDAKEQEDQAGKSAAKIEEEGKEKKPSKQESTPKHEEKEKEAKPNKEESKEVKEQVNVSLKLEKLLKEIGNLTVLELADLVKALEDKFGVSAVAVAPVAAAGQAPEGADAGPSEEQTIFNVVLTSDGGKKIQVLKAVRELNQTLTLLDAKKLVESLPKEVITQVNKKQAEEAKKKLEQAGGTVELK